MATLTGCSIIVCKRLAHSLSSDAYLEVSLADFVFRLLTRFSHFNLFVAGLVLARHALRHQKAVTTCASFGKPGLVEDDVDTRDYMHTLNKKIAHPGGRCPAQHSRSADVLSTLFLSYTDKQQRRFGYLTF